MSVLDDEDILIESVDFFYDLKHKLTRVFNSTTYVGGHSQLRGMSLSKFISAEYMLLKRTYSYTRFIAISIPYATKGFGDSDALLNICVNLQISKSVDDRLRFGLGTDELASKIVDTILQPLIENWMKKNSINSHLTKSDEKTTDEDLQYMYISFSDTMDDLLTDNFQYKTIVTI